MARRARGRVDRCAGRSLHDAQGRRRPVRTSMAVAALVLLAGACTSSNEAKTDVRRTLQAVALPDLSRLEESVQAQLRERYATLTAKQHDPGTPAADLA